MISCSWGSLSLRSIAGKGERTMTEKLEEAFRTYPLADMDELEEDSQVNIPSQQDVEDAKDWVDFKEM